MNICYSSIVNTDTVEINLIPQKKGKTENKYNKDLATMRHAVVTDLGFEGECERVVRRAEVMIPQLKQMISQIKIEQLVSYTVGHISLLWFYMMKQHP